MKHHTLFLSRTTKDVSNLPSAAVVIGAYIVNPLYSDGVSTQIDTIKMGVSIIYYKGPLVDISK